MVLMDMSQHQPPNLPPHKAPLGWRGWLIISLVLVLGVLVGLLIWRATLTVLPIKAEVVVHSKTPQKPTLEAKQVVAGYDHIWDLAFLPTREMVFTERKGAVHIWQNGTARKLLDIPDVAAQGEGGLMGIEVDPAFPENRFIYTCFNSKTSRDVRLARWRINADLTALSDRTDIITGMPASTSGRHSGCRVKFGPDGYLYVGTGDAAIGGVAADHKSLGGKILRVDRNGRAVPGNLGGDFDPRIYSWGHRNVQGLAFYNMSQQDVIGVSVEHGSTVDDEVNLLVKGNFGWALPTGPYNESQVPMTDKRDDPDAHDAIWSSGSPTVAPSGATFLRSTKWLAWQGSLAVAMLKGKHLKMITISETNEVTNTEDLFSQEFGRLRTAVESPDGDLYVSTDNGGNDQIIRITPH